MKGFLLAILLVGISIVSNAEKIGKFKIFGTVEGVANSQGVFVLDNPNAENGFEKKNFNVENGRFEIEGDISEMLSCSISFGRPFHKFFNSSSYFTPKSGILKTIIKPGSVVEIKVRSAEFLDFIINGSIEGDLQTSLCKVTFPILNREANLKVELSNISENSVLKDSIQKEIGNCKNALKKAGLQFIKENPSSYTTILYLQELYGMGLISMAEYKSMMMNVKGIYKNSSFYKKNMSQIEEYYSSQVGLNAPDIRADKDYDGKPFELKQLFGKYILIDFWGTWCNPCMKEIPHIKEFKDRNNAKLRVLGIASERGNDEKWRKVIAEKEMTWINIIDPKGAESFVKKFSVNAFPTKILISPKGKILLRSDRNENFYEEAQKIIDENR